MSPIYIAGPTASGKSAVALELAARTGGEILTVDSMQVYRGMDIGTAKPTFERDLVRHHLLDLVEVSESFSAGRWLEAAQIADREVRQRGRTPICCGGTGLYFKLLLEGLDPVPAPDLVLRAQLEATPLPVLLEELERTAPEVFARIDRQNPRRLVRAIEIERWKASQPHAAPASLVQSRGPVAGDEPNSGPKSPLFVLRRTADDLRARLSSRVDDMFRTGLIEETRSLLDRGLALNRTALQAIGYRQVVEHLQGLRDLPATIQCVKQKTWQYARRQMTWFRHRSGVVWVEAGAQDTAESIANRILAHSGIGTNSQ